MIYGYVNVAVGLCGCQFASYPFAAQGGVHLQRIHGDRRAEVTLWRVYGYAQLIYAGLCGISVCTHR